MLSATATVVLSRKELNRSLGGVKNPSIKYKPRKQLRIDPSIEQDASLWKLTVQFFRGKFHYKRMQNKKKTNRYRVHPDYCTVVTNDIAGTKERLYIGDTFYFTNSTQRLNDSFS
mmetsp:Transcript_3501/g.5459  ORF Transcript_3501/g.5459 Transcript_3501/m.5459 type:complete len:115 (-) Transcript_3501:28-372(-)